MHSSTTNTTKQITSTSTPIILDHSNSNLMLSHPNRTSFSNLNEINSNNHFSYPGVLPATSTSIAYPLDCLNLIRTWNYHGYMTSPFKIDSVSDTPAIDYHTIRNGSFHQYSQQLANKKSAHSPANDEMFLTKFHHDTLVYLDTGESKNIQQLTTNDFITSAKHSNQYSSLLARVEYIGPTDKSTGKVELRFSINDIEKLTSYIVSQEMPFFVHQHSCWSSISPEDTYRTCGLKCRQLQCDDIIIAITEQRKPMSGKEIDKKLISQRSLTKSSIATSIDDDRSSPKKRTKTSNEQ